MLRDLHLPRAPVLTPHHAESTFAGNKLTIRCCPVGLDNRPGRVRIVCGRPGQNAKSCALPPKSKRHLSAVLLQGVAGRRAEGTAALVQRSALYGVEPAELVVRGGVVDLVAELDSRPDERLVAAELRVLAGAPSLP